MKEEKNQKLTTMLILKKGIKVYDEIIATATTQTSYHRAKVAIAKLLEFKRNTTAIQKDNNSKAIAKRQNTLKIRKQYRNSRAKIVSDASNNANRKYKDITSPSFHLKMNHRCECVYNRQQCRKVQQ